MIKEKREIERGNYYEHHRIRKDYITNIGNGNFFGHNVLADIIVRLIVQNIVGCHWQTISFSQI